MNSSADSPGRRRIAGERRKKPAGATAATEHRSAEDLVEDSWTNPVDDAPSSGVAPGQAESVVDAPGDSAAAEGRAAFEDSDGTEDPREGIAATPERRARPAVYAAVAALLLSLALLAVTVGIVFRPAGPSPAEATAAVATARTSLSALLSFDAKTVSSQPAKVAPLLTGRFKTEFTDTMTKDIAPLAVKNGSTVKANVVEIGVLSQTGASVVVQAFVNQTRTSTTSPDPTIDQNRVLATLTKVDGRWLISDLKAY